MRWASQSPDRAVGLRGKCFADAAARIANIEATALIAVLRMGSIKDKLEPWRAKGFPSAAAECANRRLTNRPDREVNARDAT